MLVDHDKADVTASSVQPLISAIDKTAIDEATVTESDILLSTSIDNLERNESDEPEDNMVHFHSITMFR